MSTAAVITLDMSTAAQLVRYREWRWNQFQTSYATWQTRRLEPEGGGGSSYVDGNIPSPKDRQSFAE